MWSAGYLPHVQSMAHFFAYLEFGRREETKRWGVACGRYLFFFFVSVRMCLLHTHSESFPSLHKSIIAGQNSCEDRVFSIR